MDFNLDPETEQAAVELKGLLSDPNLISKESIAKEFYKIAKSGPALANFLEKLQKVNILHDILPEFTNMEGFTHNPKHHPEGGSTVLGHILECLRVSPFTDPVINLAVLFHDFGKAVTRGSKNGHSTYYGHEGAGVDVVNRIFDRLRFNELDAQDKKYILQAVSKHMLIHKLEELNIKTLTNLIHDPSWEVVKAVGFCDEASRGSPLFNASKFWTKIKSAEDKVGNLGNSPDELKNRIKKYIDGNKLISQFPLFEKQKNKPFIRVVMDMTRDYLMDQFNQNLDPSDEEVDKVIKGFVKKLNLL
jgi:tRNA nucleotidyltransferase/poly(A) polymerase